MNVKNYFLSGNLANDNLKLRAHNYQELGRGVWHMSINQCLLENYTNEEYCVGLSTNYVKGYRSSDTFDVTSTFSVLNVFILEKEKKQEKHFQNVWHCVNNFSDELMISLFDLKTNKKLKINCDIHLVIQFQRVQ
jgi:hypothetical protein